MLEWAINDSGLSMDDLADRIPVPLRELRSWLQGKDSPTKTQFARLAEILRKPSALFFRTSPPEVAPPSFHLRAPTGVPKRPVTPDERRAIADAQRLQRLLHWLLERGGASPIALDGTAALRAWRGIAEEAGIVVLQEEFGRDGIRGFMISDPLAPMVGVNSSFAMQARIFSLFHEIGHLLAHHNSACLGFVRPAQQYDKDERWAERFAAAFLLPEAPVVSYVRSRHQDGAATLETVRALSGTFKVSARATALRLIDLKLAPPELYGQVVKAMKVFD